MFSFDVLSSSIRVTYMMSMRCGGYGEYYCYRWAAIVYDVQRGYSRLDYNARYIDQK